MNGSKKHHIIPQNFYKAQSKVFLKESNMSTVNHADLY